MSRYLAYLNTTSLDGFQELKTFGLTIYSQVYVDVNQDTGEIVLADLGTHNTMMSISSTVMNGSRFWRKPIDNIVYFRSINIVVFGHGRAGRCMLYWCPSEFGVLLLARDNGSRTIRTILENATSNASELAEMGAIPWKLVKLLKEIKL